MNGVGSVRRLIGLVATLASLVCFPSAVFGQALASITGTVKDTSGAVLPGVTVEAASPVLIEKVRTVVSDGTGQYRIEQLRPGSYTVTFTLPGFNSFKRDGIELTGSLTAVVNADMKVGAVEETITVTGETPIVDVQNAVRQRVIDQEALASLPAGRSEHGLAVLVPGITATTSAGIRQDVGGTAHMGESNMAIHGGSRSDQRININGMTIGVNGGANDANGANALAYQEMTVDTAAVSAEQAFGGVRVNLIPREGANSFHGLFFGTYDSNAWEGDNFTQALKDRGLVSASSMRRLWDVDPTFGGPILKDKLWFYFSYRYDGNESYPGGIHFNLNANNPTVYAYAPDLSGNEPFNSIHKRNAQIRLTWQVTPKNKVGATVEEAKSCFCAYTTNATTAPEGSDWRVYPEMHNWLVDWQSPMTNRLLFEAAAFTHLALLHRIEPDLVTNPLMISTVDQGLGNLLYRSAAPSALRDNEYPTFYTRGAMSYITGAHAIKVGYQFGASSQLARSNIGTLPFQYRVNSATAASPGVPVPNQITLYAPGIYRTAIDQDSGAYAQDKWTFRRLTLNYGVRWDWNKNSAPAITEGPTQLAPNRNLTFPAAQGVSWKDVTPKSALVYDVFGDGKTAVKVSLNKYMGSALDPPFGFSGTAPSFANPSTDNQLVDNTTRAWTDTNRNFIPDCNLLNPAAQTVAGGDTCGAMANPNFGGVNGTSQGFDPSVTNGYGHRLYNWEFSSGIQRQVSNRVSVDVSYFRRWWGNFQVLDNLAVDPSDFTRFSVTPTTSDPRLSTAGKTIGGFLNVNPNKFSAVPNYFVSLSDQYGNQIQHWNGVDLTLNARPRGGMLLQGGLSTGYTLTDNCEILAKIPETSPTGLPYCRQETPWLTQVKWVASYPVPRIGVQVAATFQSLPGPAVGANYAAPNAEVQSSLGRPLSGGAANVTVGLLPPGTQYGERMNQMDFRVAKTLRYRTTRTLLNVDLYNALNASPVLLQNDTFGGALLSNGSPSWQQPQQILLARFVKFSVQFEF